jgi:hypothetical protein
VLDVVFEPGVPFFKDGLFHIGLGGNPGTRAGPEPTVLEAVLGSESLSLLAAREVP